MKYDFDVIIIGAGAAGLACAEKLVSSGKKCLLVEARNRIGGRVYSLTSQGDFPIELGAEFVHGVPEYTLSWLRKLELGFYDVQDCHQLLRNRKLVDHPDFWDELQKIMASLRPDRKIDQSISEFLKNHNRLNKQTVPFFKSFVEGFHGADLSVIGEQALAATEETDDEKLNGAKMFRSIKGYNELLLGILKSYSKRIKLKMEFKVDEINWSNNSALIRGQNIRSHVRQKFTSKKIVVTVPVGVLKSNSIRFEPYPKELTTFLENVEMGHVQRLLFKFKERFWEDLSEKPISFLHAQPEKNFPTWWTFQPLRVPFLVAWQGGPRALVLSKLSKNQRSEQALKTLAQLTGKSRLFLKSQVEEIYEHNWSRDPFSLGAYSYVKVGGIHKWQAAREIENTLYFAGEGLALGSSRGTVHGAFATGLQAAEKIVRSL